MAKTKTSTKTSQNPEKTKEVSALGIYQGEKLIRVYSEELHGKDYQNLAKEYLSHNRGEARPYTPPPPAPAEPKEETTVVNVFAPSGDLVRTYSLSGHGKDYKKLAEQFIEKFPKRGYRLE